MFFLSDEELQELLNNIDEVGQALAKFETDYKSSEREIKLIKASIAEEMKPHYTSQAAIASAVEANDMYAEKVKELRTKQYKYLSSAAKLDHLKSVFEAWRTYSANIRSGT